MPLILASLVILLLCVISIDRNSGTIDVCGANTEIASPYIYDR